jgi:integrase
VEWLNNIGEKLRDKLTQVGLLDGSRAATNKPLTESIEEYVQFLAAKERTEKYLRDNRLILNRIFTNCGFRFWSNVSATKVMAYLKALRDDGMSYARSNSYLVMAKSFCKWVVQYKGAIESPLRHLKPLNAKLDKRRVRRALEVDEVRRLLEATKNGPERYTMSGYERFLVYRLAVETGLRSKEIRRLKVGSFDFVNRIVTIEAVDAKGKREDAQTLRPDTAAMLKQFFDKKMPGVNAFGGSSGELTKRTAQMIEADLAATEVKDTSGAVLKEAVPYIDDVGRVADFHSLRHSCGTLLAASGAHPKVVQKIMRHTDINLTMSLYTHVLKGQESQAVNALPDFSTPSSQTMRKTGTDDLGSDSQELDGNARTSVDSHGRAKPINTTKTSFSEHKSPPKANS